MKTLLYLMIFLFSSSSYAIERDDWLPPQTIADVKKLPAIYEINISDYEKASTNTSCHGAVCLLIFLVSLGADNSDSKIVKISQASTMFYIGLYDDNGNLVRGSFTKRGVEWVWIKVKSFILDKNFQYYGKIKKPTDDVYYIIPPPDHRAIIERYRDIIKNKPEAKKISWVERKLRGYLDVSEPKAISKWRWELDVQTDAYRILGKSSMPLFLPWYEELTLKEKSIALRKICRTATFENFTDGIPIDKSLIATEEKNLLKNMALCFIPYKKTVPQRAKLGVKSWFHAMLRISCKNNLLDLTYINDVLRSSNWVGKIANNDWYRGIDLWLKGMPSQC